MKISFITTVYNEEKTIDSLLKSLFSQSKLPDEIIIVDGGSKDLTVSKIKNQKSKIKNFKGKFLILCKKGNRSIGRNEAIKRAKGDIIACSDSGNILDKKWLENITKPFTDKSIDVVAGYYAGLAKNVFQKCLVPYVLVMPGRIDPHNFLPATRSMAFTKAIWKKAGGFDERFSHNEDYVFANKLKEAGAKIVFARDAIVNWIPRKSFKEAFVMFFRFAFGDAESGILRTSVLLLFTRYFLASYLIFLSLLYKSFTPAAILFVSFIFYIYWSIKKNYKYVKDKEAIKILPLLQFTSDFGVLFGTAFGLLKRVKQFNYLIYTKQNKFLFFIIAAYISIMLLTLKWGIPNQNHPFNYQMDEWHQSQAVRTVFTKGTPNIEGSANGSMFHFLLSGIYLVPFIIFGLLNPFAIKSSVTSLDMQERLFEILRVNTLLFGLLSIFILTYIGKKYFKLNKFLVAFLFVFNPMWLSLSNYFKYDIALVFWILLGLLFLLKFAFTPNVRNYLIAGAICALSFAVKLSAIPLLPAYILAFLAYFPQPRKNISKLFLGIAIYIGVFILLGIPDLILGRGNIYEYLDANLRRSPATASNYIFGMDYLSFLILTLYPASFGHGLYLFFLIGILFSLMWLIKSFYYKKLCIFKILLLKNKARAILILAFIFFLISLIPLKIEARANRLLVLLPFIVLFVSFYMTKVYRILKKTEQKIIFIGIAFIFVLLQLFETYGWVWMKIATDPRVSSSNWLQRNVKEGTKIGLENIPIYQMLPDIILKEFYNKQYGLKIKNKFEYQVIDSKTSKLPNLVIVTNGEIESKYLLKSTKKDLITRLKKENYKVIASFQPDFKYYSFYGNCITFYIAGLVIAPNTIAIFSKN